MNTNLTEVVLIIDRSGSMANCREEAENGINTFIKDQSGKDGECVLSLAQFDTEYELVHDCVPIADVPEFDLIPRNFTALLDAVGKTINDVGSRLNATPEEQRPGLVIVAIVTDGKENASHEFTRQRIKEMIEHQKSVYSWQFTYLGANQDAFTEAGNIGITRDATCNYSDSEIQTAFVGLSANVGRMRSASVAGNQVLCAYTEDERSSMV